MLTCTEMPGPHLERNPNVCMPACATRYSAMLKEKALLLQPTSDDVLICTWWVLMETLVSGRVTSLLGWIEMPLELSKAGPMLQATGERNSCNSTQMSWPAAILLTCK